MDSIDYFDMDFTRPDQIENLKRRLRTDRRSIPLPVLSMSNY